jgi:hypothetical protein
MKKNQEIKKLYDIFIDSTHELDSKLQTQIKKIKQEQNNLILLSQIKLLKLVCEGEGLNYDEIKHKYIKQKEIEKPSIPSQSSSSENIFVKIILNDKTYYYEQKENGDVYDSESNKVGIFINNEVQLTQ